LIYLKKPAPSWFFYNRFSIMLEHFYCSRLAHFMAHFFIITANLIWGGLPIFFYFFTDTSPLFMLAMQIIFTWVILHLNFKIKPREKSQSNTHSYTNVSQASPPKSLLKKAKRDGLKDWLKYIPSTCFIGANWGVYALTVQSGHALEASYAYLITPILFAIVDYLLPANRKDKAMLLLMSAAIVLITLDAVIEQVLPIAGIFIGACFTAYILWHRHKALAPITALKRETTLLLPFAGILLLTLVDPKAQWESLTALQIGLLPLIGVLTCLTLGLFIIGSKTVPFSQISLYQFISPIAGTFVAVALFEETFSVSKIIIYAGLISILCLNLYLTRRKLAKMHLFEATAQAQSH
jgi:chloramphenicol-sensitive protein RarD